MMKLLLLLSYLFSLSIQAEERIRIEPHNEDKPLQKKKSEVSDTLNVIVKVTDKAGKKYLDKLMKKAKKKSRKIKKNYKINREIKRFDLVSMKLPFDEVVQLKKQNGIQVEIDAEMKLIDPVPLKKGTNTPDDADTPLSSKNTKKHQEWLPYGISMVLQDFFFWSDPAIAPPPPIGSSIKICVADTGYDFGHQDLPITYVTGRDSPENGSWDTDVDGHGTHVAGTIAARWNGIGGSVVGIFPDDKGGNFELIIAKALNDLGSTTSSALLEAVQGCVEQGANVVNLSLGGRTPSIFLEDAFSEMAEINGVLFVAAAGNTGETEYFYPASYPSMMAVAAVDFYQDTAYFSTRNDRVEVGAPGVNILSTIPNNSYDWFSGTSMASPHVAGVAGLLWLYFPSCKNYQIREVLKRAADYSQSGLCSTHQGHGVVQAQEAYDILSAGFCDDDPGYFEPETGCNLRCDSDSDCLDDNDGTIDMCIRNYCSNECTSPITTIYIGTDLFPSETTFEIKALAGEVVSADGPFENFWTTYSLSICLASGRYEFTIKDSFGDGLGLFGFYEVYVGNTLVVSGSGNFGYSETKSFNI